MEDEDRISSKLDDNRRFLEGRVGVSTSFDVIFREMTFGGRRCGMFYVNGFAKDLVLTEIIDRLSKLDPDQITPNSTKQLLEEYVIHIQVDPSSSMKDVIEKVLAGGTALFVDHEDTALIIDAKEFPQRSPEEPEIERVVRGAKDGFIESLLTNVSLVRRRLRDPGLRLEVMSVGLRTKTDVCVAYITDITDPILLKNVKDKIKSIQIDGMPMADKQLEEAIIGKGWNPFPSVRYSERPDVVASHLLEGHICIFVDTSPSVLLVPATFFQHVQHAEENRETPFIGTYLRWVRYFGIFASIFLLPLWFLFVIEPDILPKALSFIGPEKTGRLPILLQFLLAEIGVDLTRMAAIHTPTPLAIAVGLMSTILIGDIAVNTGLFINEVILYLAVASIGMFATPSYELALANRIVRLLLLVLVAIFKVPGIVVGTTLVMFMLITQRAFRTPYFWPFIPFNAQGLYRILVRTPFLSDKTRPSITRPKQDRKMPRG